MEDFRLKVFRAAALHLTRPAVTPQVKKQEGDPGRRRFYRPGEGSGG